MSLIVNAYLAMGKTYMASREPKTYHDMDFGRHLKNKGVNPLSCVRDEIEPLAQEWGDALEIADFEGVCLTNTPLMRKWDVTVLPCFNRSEFERRLAARGDNVSDYKWDFTKSVAEWREAALERSSVLIIADNLNAIPLKVWVGIAELLHKGEAVFPTYSQKERKYFANWVNALLTPINNTCQELIWR